MIEKALKDIQDDLKKNPLKEGEQLNLTGYSYGSILLSHVALRLADQGVKVDNLVLIGSPVPSDSLLFKELETHPNIGKIIRHDIPGDYLSNPSDVEMIQGAWQNLGDDGPHFDLARPDNPKTLDVDEGAIANQKIEDLAKKLVQEGVK